MPESDAEQVKKALFEVGAGKIGHYSCCAWQIKGEGQFMPLRESRPIVGEVNRLEKVIEYKVEMICSDVFIQAAIAALKKAHPYETPAYDVTRVEDF